jgi:Predicted ATPase (AAA+ superfamily)
VTMMANVIATVISNTRWGEERVGVILRKMGRLSAPVDASPELLAEFARSTDLGILDQLAVAIASVLDNHPDQAETEAQALFEAGANPALYGRIASWVRHPHVRWQFSLLREVFNAKAIPETWKQVSAIIAPWRELERASDSTQFAAAVQNFMATVADQIQITTGVSGKDPNSIWYGVVLETEKIFGYNINRLPFFFPQQGNLDEDNLDRLRKFAQEGLNQQYTVLVLVSWAFNLPRKQALDAQDALRKELVDLVILDVSDILRILQSPDPTEVFRRLVLRQVRVTPPYVIRGAVPAKMFFGREAELRRLVENAGMADFAIVGNRRIGKTSLLHFTHTRLEAAGRVQPLLIDCQTVSTVAEFFTAFQAQQNQVALPGPTSAAFVEVATQCSKSGKPLVLLMDEVDDLLRFEREHGESLLGVWRQLAQAGICHFIFCGSRRLAQDVDDPLHQTLYNFPQPLPLGCLDSETAQKVLTEPLDALDIAMEEKTELIRQVMELTSGHPYLIQYVGWELVNAANDYKRTERKILLSDLDALRTSAKFADEYLRTIWGHVGSLEKLITLLAPAEGFKVEAIEELLAKEGLQIQAKQVDAALKMLRIYAILDKQEQTYTFIPRAFHDILQRTQPIKRLIDEETKLLQSTEG